MKFNWDFELKWTNELKTSLINAMLGIGVGFLTTFIHSGKLALAFAIVIAYAFGQIVQRVLKWQPFTEQPDGTKKYATKWWLGNGFYPFFIFWLFCWVLFYNIL